MRRSPSSASTGRRSTSSASILSIERGRRSIPGRHPGACRPGKPVAITEFGTAAYRGASDKGARAGEIVEWSETTIAPSRLRGDVERDETEQVTYLRELLDVFETEGVDSAFVFTFVATQFPHRPDGDPRDDLDVGSYAIVKTLDSGRGTTYPDMPWEPKAAFAALAEVYGRR